MTLEDHLLNMIRQQFSILVADCFVCFSGVLLLSKFEMSRAESYLVLLIQNGKTNDTQHCGDGGL